MAHDVKEDAKTNAVYVHNERDIWIFVSKTVFHLMSH